MKTMWRAPMKTMRSLLLALPLLAGSGAALAGQDRDHDHGHGRDHGQDRDHGHGYAYGHERGRGDEDDRDRDGRDGDRRHEHGWHGDYDRDHRWHPWERGHRYYGPVYEVRDYRSYRLRPPPRGYHWVRDDNDYLLIGIGTGIILDMVIH